jgi:uncharacterized protein YjbI with pentapeptide repeats
MTMSALRRLAQRLPVGPVLLANTVFLSLLALAALLVFVFEVGELRQAAGWVFCGVFVFGGALWLAAALEPEDDGEHAKVWGELGRSLLVAGLMAFAVWAVSELRRPSEARHSLQLSLGAQQSMPGIDLHGEDLSGFNLSGKDLSGADLAGANLAGASLIGTNLARADLSDANLTGAEMKKTSLAGARLDRAQMEGARAEQADLTGARLPEADLTDARLGGALLQDSCLSGASLAEARLPDAHLEGADLHAADLQGTYFWFDLRATYLDSVGLRGARHAGEAHWPPKMRNRYHDLVHPSRAGAPHAIVSRARHQAEVRYVPDGDTMTLNIKKPHRMGLLKVRLIGIDSPDLEDEGGHAARESLRELLPVGAHVTYQYDAVHEDKLSRRLLYVYGPNRRLVNQVMLEEGRATARLAPLGDRTALRYSSKLEEGEAWAREHALGMWRTCPP